MGIIKQILSSKKALATIAAILVWTIGRAGLEVSAEELLPILGLLASFVVGQGIADKGKEAVREALKAPLDPPRAP